MNIQLAIQHGTNILTDKRINTAKLDAEILMAKTLKKDRKFIMLNNNKDLEDKNLKYFNKLIKERASHKPIAHLINKKFISDCKKPFYLLNTSRGECVNTEDLIFALKDGKVLGAGLDVLENETKSFFSLNDDVSFEVIKKFENVMKSKKRGLCAPPAPPEGLFLSRIIY